MKARPTTVVPPSASATADYGLHRWRTILLGAAFTEASLFFAIGISHTDREALAFGVLFVFGGCLLFWRRQVFGVLALVLLAVDTLGFMAGALVTNVTNEATIAVVQALALIVASVLVLVAAGAWLLQGRTATRPSARGPITVAGSIFVVAFAAELLLGGQSVTQTSGSQLALTAQNAAFSAKTLTASPGEISVEVNNRDLFWHTFTIDGVVSVAVPGGAHKLITFRAPAGTYTFYCAIPGHRQAGMVGTLTVH